MKLDLVKLTNFRSIKKCIVQTSDITALIGENNSGKSALLRGLNSFFNYSDEECDFIKGYHQYTPRSRPTIELVFSSLPEDLSLAQNAREDGKLTLRLQYRPQTKKVSFSYKNNENKYTSIDEDTITKLKKHINFVLIPPARELSEIQKAETNVLNELIETYLDKATGERDNINPKFRQAAKYLEDNALKKIARSISKFYILRHDFGYHIKFGENLNYKDFLSKITILIQEGLASHQLYNCGTGIQSITIIALYRLLSSLQHKNIILGIEEPETNLHPQAQKELIYSLKNSIGCDNLSQIVLTTHAPLIIDQIDHTQVALFRKVKSSDTKRSLKTEVTAASGNFFDTHNLDTKKYSQFHIYRNSDFFYAKLVVIVESRIDAEVIKYLLQSKGYNLDVYGVSIINLDGVANLKYPLFLIEELKIPHLIVVDKDFFIPYINGKRANSLDGQGFPKYKYEYKRQCPVEKLIPNAERRQQLLRLFKTNHSKALDLLERNHLVCMKYALEVDLISSDKAAEAFYEVLSIPPESRNKQELLIRRHQTIKSLDNILAVLEQIGNRNLPRSYSRIRKIIIDNLKSATQ